MCIKPESVLGTLYYKNMASKHFFSNWGDMFGYIERSVVSKQHRLFSLSYWLLWIFNRKLFLRAAAMTLRTVLLSLQALLSAAEPDDPQDAVVARQYKENIEMFKLTARHWTNAYAGGKTYFGILVVDRFTRFFDVF